MLCGYDIYWSCCVTFQMYEGKKSAPSPWPLSVSSRPTSKDSRGPGDQSNQDLILKLDLASELNAVLLFYWY